MKKTEITPLIRQKTILVCADLLLEMLDDGRKLNPNGKALVEMLETLLEVTYKDAKISGNDTMQAAKDKILYNIDRHFKL